MHTQGYAYSHTVNVNRSKLGAQKNYYPKPLLCVKGTTGAKNNNTCHGGFKGAVQ